MRQVICAFAIDHLDAEQITSGAYTDNPASLAVSRKCGYTENGREFRTRMGKRAALQRMVLEPANLVRYQHELTVEGLPDSVARLASTNRTITDGAACLSERPSQCTLCRRGGATDCFSSWARSASRHNERERVVLR